MRKNKKRKKRLRAVLILLIILFILAGLGGMLYVSHRDKVEKEQRREAALAALDSIPFYLHIKLTTFIENKLSFCLIPFGILKTELCGISCYLCSHIYFCGHGRIFSIHSLIGKGNRFQTDIINIDRCQPVFAVPDSLIIFRFKCRKDCRDRCQ